MDPYSALAWMNAHGYATAAVYYPATQTIGFPYEYMAWLDPLGYVCSTGGTSCSWQLVFRVE
jgi:hypothetical protein